MWFADHRPRAHADVDAAAVRARVGRRTTEQAVATIEMMRCVTPANVLGLPSACVPAGLVDGLPVGVLLTGDRFADDKTLDAAEVVEAALGLATPIDPVT